MASVNEAMVAHKHGDTATAVRDLLAHAEEGDVSAQVYVGELYKVGNGVDKDLRETMKWYARAAEQGSVDAQFAPGP